MKKLKKIMAIALACAICSANAVAITRAEGTSYADTTPGEKPANLITSALVIDGLNAGEISRTTGSDTEKYTMKSGGSGANAWNVFAGSSMKAGLNGGEYMSIQSFAAGKTYVYSAKVKNTSTDTSLIPYYGVAYNTKSYSAAIGTNEYGKKGMPVTSTDWMDFKATITFGESWDETIKATMNGQVLQQGMGYSSPDSSSLTVSKKLADLYLAEEVPYDINIVTEENKVNAATPLNLTAEIQNQIGIKGQFAQNISWLALDEARTAEESKIHISASGNTATITVDADLAYGKYVILAKATDYGFQKGFVIEVAKPPVTDYVAQATASNLIQAPGNSGFASGSSGITATTGNASGVSYYNVKTTSAVTAAAAGLDVDASNTEQHGIIGTNNIVAGKTYLVYAKVRTTDSTGTPYFNAYIKGVDTNSNAVELTTLEYTTTGMALTSQWQEFKGTIVTPTTLDVKTAPPAKKTKLVLGLNKGTASGVSADVALSVQIVEEEPIKVTLTPSSTSAVGADDSVDISAAFVNQLDFNGSLEQKFTWSVYDSARTEVLDLSGTDMPTLEVSQDTKTATLKTDIFTEKGDYYVAARATNNSQFITMTKVTVDKPTAEECVIDFVKTATESELISKLPTYLPALGISVAGVNIEGTAKLIVNERDNGVTDYVEFIKKAIAVAAYKDLTNVYTSDGSFTEDAVLNLKELDTAGVTIYSLFTSGMTADGRIAVQEAMQGEYTNFTDFENKFMEEVILKTIQYPAMSGTGFIAEILTAENTAAAGIVATEFLDLSDKTAASPYIMSNAYTKATLEAAIAVIDTTIASGSSGQTVVVRPSQVTTSGGKVTIASGETASSSSSSSEGGAEGTGTAVSYDLFTDVTEAHWAYKDIYYLQRINVINGVGGSRFEPEGYLNREQLVKILCAAFEYDLVGDATSFSDVVSGAWYEPYVATAYSKGVVKGISTSVFGVGRIITREDMCVMITRALGIELSTDFDLDFTDAESVSPYARASVAYLSSIGVISGFGDGRFGPKEPCTRAQAAKIICRILNMEGVVTE